MKALIVYCSETGNTEKASQAMRRGLEGARISTTLKHPAETGLEELFDYDLVCMGSPVHSLLPAEPIFTFVKEKRSEARVKGYEKLGSPRVPGKKAIVFCTYGGPHTGSAEATPTLKLLGQFFDHIGIDVVAELGLVGELHRSIEASTKGRLGDIRGKPTEEELLDFERKVAEIAKKLIGESMEGPRFTS